MAKITLPTVNSGYLSTEALNQAFADVAEAFDNTLSRDGSTPNQMIADLDMNGYGILNLGADSDLLTRDAMEDYVDSRASGMLMIRHQSYTATASQTVFNITDFSYEVGAENLAVYVNGVRKFTPTDYVETDTDTITFNVGLTAADKVEILNTEFVANITMAAHTHPWGEITNIPVYASRWPTWDEVTGKPATFTPATHNHTASEITSGRLADARRGVHVQASTPTATTVGELWFW